MYRALWRHKIMIVVLTAAILAGAYYLTKREQKLYTASTLVRVIQRVQNSGEAFLALQTGGRLAQTYANIAASRPIANGIFVDLKKTVPLSEIHISGSQIQDLELLRISATSPNPAHAQLVANAAPHALEEFIRDTGTLRDQIVVIDPAGYPSAPSSPSLRLNLMMALLLALAFNAALAILVEIMSDRVGSGEDLERIVGKPVLTVMPEMRLAGQGSGHDREREPTDDRPLGAVGASRG